MTRAIVYPDEGTGKDGKTGTKPGFIAVRFVH